MPEIPTRDRSDLIQQAEQLLENITPGEWRVSMTGYSVKSATDDMPIVAQNPWGTAMSKPHQIEPWLENAGFIAAAPQLVRDLVAALRAVEEEQGWRDIATAPKDGTRILATQGHYVGVFRWVPRGEAGILDSRGVTEGWRDEHNWTADNLTHWRPLPAPTTTPHASGETTRSAGEPRA